MDDGLVLNISTESPVAGPSRTLSAKKGGRWTERVKAKRVAKRKIRPSEDSQKSTEESSRRPTKRAKVASDTSSPPKRAAPKAHAGSQTARSNVISSLFSSNPKLPDLEQRPTLSRISRPSNAPLTDASTFTGLGLDPLVAQHLETKMGISKPTSVQRASLAALTSSGKPQENMDCDLFIQSQTGSGKTLAFLLPVLQDLLPLSKLSYIDRSIGTLAVIIAPTRELAKQISDVLEQLLKLRLRAEDDVDGSGERLTRWMVSGLLVGGATRAHEKAKLRKGVPILVSTPGRLLDHLQNTSSFEIGKCRWLVLDEADRLMELGFEETITGIIKGLDGRRRLAIKALETGSGGDVGGWEYGSRRRNILCSATIREDVQKLAGTTLVNPIVIRSSDSSTTQQPLAESSAAASEVEKFTPPSQLTQKYVVVPLKLRLVVLLALLRSLISHSQAKKGTKVIVFFSCTHSVDYHFNLFGGLSMNDGDEASAASSSEDEGDSDNKDTNSKPSKEQAQVQCPLLPDTSIYRLHGSLDTRTRLASLQQFSAPSQKSSSTILFCTSVASRGLDLPLVRAVVQYDLPTEGGATEYVHRVGRTARAGKGGEAWSIVAPSESEWVKWVEKGMSKSDGAVSLSGSTVDTVLRNGFGGKGSEYEQRATQVQLSFERWVLSRKENIELARKAFLAHMRAYATHPSIEKHMFHIKHLHTGHLAKAFALREAPGAVSASGQKVKVKVKRQKNGPQRAAKDLEIEYDKDAERRMQDVVRSQGRLTKKGGVMMSSGVSEFQLTGGYDLEKMVGA